MENSDIPQIAVHSSVVHPWHVDQFGHMNVRWYAHCFDDASFLFWERLNLGQNAMRSQFHAHTVTASAKTDFASELLAGDCIRVYGLVEKIGTKSVTLNFELRSFRTTDVHARYQTVEVFVDADSHESMPMPPAVRERLERIGS
jgi:acyl-CoA thioester hydrolase